MSTATARASEQQHRVAAVCSDWISTPARHHRDSELWAVLTRMSSKLPPAACLGASPCRKGAGEEEGTMARRVAAPGPLYACSV